MGNIHMRCERYFIQLISTNRYDEAIDCYSRSIERCLMELENLFEISSLENFYQVKLDWENMESEDV
jgi:hypothetical protein